MTHRFAFFYLMKDDLERVRAAVPSHVTHWHELDLQGYLGGPFDDRTGGLITFESDSIENAEGNVRTDPFIEQDLIASYWVKEWVPEREVVRP
jgi:uncharacterized protein YciI